MVVNQVLFQFYRDDGGPVSFSVFTFFFLSLYKLDRVKRNWYLSPMRAAKVQALLAHTSSDSRGTFRQKARSLAPLNGCAVKVCHDGMLEDTNSLDGAQFVTLAF